MHRLLASTIGCVACVAMASTAQAQLVRIGPFGGVSVRAPFVSVDTLPFGGGTRVRAPFVSVNTRAYAYGYGYRPYQYDYYRPYGPVYYDPVAAAYRVPIYTPPLYPDIVYPQAGEYRAAQPPISAQDPAALPDRLRAAALQLKRSLSLRRDDSDVWLNYLAPDRIVQAIDSSEDPSSLSDLLLNYEGVVGNGSLASISRAGGFAETHRFLQAFVSRPADSAAPKATTENGESNSDSVLPSPSSEADSGSKTPTPAAPVQPADDGDNQEVRQSKEELPLPPPEPTPL